MKTCDSLESLIVPGDSKPRRSILVALILRSWLYSYVSWFIALVMFTVIDQGISFFIHQETHFILSIVGMFFLIGAILSFIPVGFGAVVLAGVFYWFTLRGWRISNLGRIIGSALGSILVLGISGFIFALVISSGKGSDIRVIIWTIEAVILGSIAGGWTGSRLVQWLDSKRFAPKEEKTQSTDQN